MPDLALFDCHCHLQAPEFDRDREEVIERARAVGVVRVLAVAEDRADADRVLELADRHADFVVPALGVHPDRAPLVSDEEVADIEALIRVHADQLGAVGEVGLDFRPCWDDAARDRQRDVFRHVIRLARELSLPLSVHSRSAGHHTIDLLLEVEGGPDAAASQDADAGGVTACLHAFDGRAAHGERGSEAGLAFSIPPSVVRSRVKQKLVPRLPGSALLLESDSPVLGPDAELRNEPANLVVALEEIGRLRSVAPAELALTLAANTERVFPALHRA